MNEAKRVGYINKSDTGLWGTLTFDDNKLYIRNVRKISQERIVADIQADTGNTFLNKANKVCKEYKTVGALVMTSVSGELALSIGGKNIKESFEVSQHSSQKGDYMRLTFAEPNPYLAGLMATVSRGNEQLDIANVPQEQPAVDIPDSLPF